VVSERETCSLVVIREHRYIISMLLRHKPASKRNGSLELSTDRELKQVYWFQYAKRAKQKGYTSRIIEIDF
jgi:hypothetical protein